MFTGIVVDTGTITEIPSSAAPAVRIRPTRMPPPALRPGASVACSGICLTATSIDSTGLAVDLSPETLARTTAGRWRPGTRINLEYALRAGDPLDGHIVTGHVDAVAAVLAVAAAGDSRTVRMTLPDRVSSMVAPKGSVAVDGVSLTVNAVDGEGFSVTLIPHTRRVTTLGTLAAGRSVNLEADILARYVARALPSRIPGDRR